MTLKGLGEVFRRLAIQRESQIEARFEQLKI
jgi:hypothetical protein